MSKESKQTKAKRIGITGGIASGKSTVLDFLRKEGYRVIDADAVVHDLQKKGGKLYQALLDFFGADILLDNGELNRPKLSELVFSNPDVRTQLAQLQDSIIRLELFKQCDVLAQTEDLFFVDIPLLFERSYQSWFDEIWLVYVDEERQLERFMARNQYSKEEAKQRIASQLSLENKKKLADKIIDNRGDLEETLLHVTKELNRLKASK